MYALLAGLFIGIVSLIRPLDGTIAAFLLGIWSLLRCPSLKDKVATSASLILGTIVSGSMIFPYNKAVTGDAMLLPMDAYYTKYFWEKVMAPGFGANRGISWELDAFPGHSPLEAIVNASLNIFSVNIELLGWATGSILLAACFIFSGSLRKADFWALAVILVVTGCYSLYWYHGGPDFGARYWFLCIVPFIALTVRGIEWLSSRLPYETPQDFHLNVRVISAVAILSIICLASYVPWRATDKYYHYLEMRPDMRQMAEKYFDGNSLVLIRGNEHPDYQSAWIYNPLNFEGDAPIYAWDKDPQIRKQLLKSYSGRQVWVVDGPTITNAGYRISAGPIDANELLKLDTR